MFFAFRVCIIFMRKPQHFDVKEAKLNKPESPVIIGYADDFKHAQVQFYFRYKYKNDKKSLRFDNSEIRDKIRPCKS